MVMQAGIIRLIVKGAKSLWEIMRFMEEYYTKHTAGETNIAELYMLLGDFDKTFEWLDRAYEARVSRLTDIYRFPEWDPIRSDPRYTALLKKMGFPEER